MMSSAPISRLLITSSVLLGITFCAPLAPPPLPASVPPNAINSSASRMTGAPQNVQSAQTELEGGFCAQLFSGSPPRQAPEVNLPSGMGPVSTPRVFSALALDQTTKLPITETSRQLPPIDIRNKKNDQAALPLEPARLAFQPLSSLTLATGPSTIQKASPNLNPTTVVPSSNSTKSAANVKMPTKPDVANPQSGAPTAANPPVGSGNGDSGHDSSDSGGNSDIAHSSCWKTVTALSVAAGFLALF